MNIRFLPDPEWPINNIDRKHYLSDTAVKGNVGASVFARARAERFIPILRTCLSKKVETVSANSPALSLQKAERRGRGTLGCGATDSRAFTNFCSTLRMDASPRKPGTSVDARAHIWLDHGQQEQV